LNAQLSSYAGQGFSGTVLVVREGRVVLLKGYGLANITDSIPNMASTRFEMNSMTKMFTGVSVLQLAGAGRLALEDPIERYLGPFAVAKPGATVHHLALHTAGLVPAGTPLNGESRDAFVRDVGRAPRESPPGASYRYTNAGYSLLAAIVERASGESFEAYLRRHIFTPAGMRTAIFRTEVPPKDARFAHGYVAGPTGRTPGPPNPYGWGTIGAGGVWCTVGDIYRWLLFVESGKAFPARFRPLLFAPPPAPSLEAFGWHYNARTGSTRTRIDKGGGSGEFASQLLYYPDERVVIVWASNDLSKRWRQTLNQAIPDIVFTGRTDARAPR
jgi:CubicO group peptidase (beta-lactamase class C family)